MKNLFLFILMMATITVSMQAQKIGHPKIKKSNDIVWFGIDFSKLQCVGRAGFEDPKNIAESKVHSWNSLMIEEHEKFNINKAFQKKAFHYDIASSEKQNDKLSADGLLVPKAKDFDKETVQSILSNYSSEEYPTGLGLVFIVEKFDKNEVIANIHVTFFDIASKEIVQVIKYTGKPGGFGLRNFWAGAINDVIDKLEGDYKKWMKKNK